MNNHAGSWLYYALAVTAAVYLSIIALGAMLRIHNVRSTARVRRLEQQWSIPVFAALANASRTPMIGLVSAGDELPFVNFIVRLARRVSGHEREILREMVGPFLPAVAGRVHARRAEHRAAALQTIGLLRPLDYAPLFVAALDDPDPDVAMVAAVALARPEQAAHADAVYDHLERYGRWSMRSVAQMAAGFGPRAAPQLHRVFMNRARSAWVRATAGHALFIVRDVGSADLAAEVVEAESDRDLMLAAIYLLGEYGAQRHVPALRELADHTDFVIRAEAIEALGQIGQQQELRRVQAALGDENAWVALRAARALRQAHAVDLLQESASDTGRAGIIAREVLAQPA